MIGECADGRLDSARLDSSNTARRAQVSQVSQVSEIRGTHVKTRFPFACGCLARQEHRKNVNEIERKVRRNARNTKTSWARTRAQSRGLFNREMNWTTDARTT